MTFNNDTHTLSFTHARTHNNWTDATGLKIVELEEGGGNDRVKKGDRVTVSRRGQA